MVPAEKLIADNAALKKAIAIDNLRTRLQHRRMEQMDTVDEQTERELLSSPTPTAPSQTQNQDEAPAEVNNNLTPANANRLENARDEEMPLTPSTLLPLQIDNTALNLDPALELPPGMSNGVSSPIVPPSNGTVNPESFELTRAANMLGTINKADPAHRHVIPLRPQPGDDDYRSEDDKSDVEDMELEIALRRRDGGRRSLRNRCPGRPGHHHFSVQD